MAVNREGVVSCYRERRISQKKGTEYEVLVLVFENGYKMDTFLTNEQLFIIRDIIPCVN